jgi:transcriptional regulator with XRE-family HTH domain
MMPAGGTMVIGEKLKILRAQKKMSQGDVEKRTGLLRCYISRVENGHTVPSVDTLEKMARALEIPMYRLLTDDAHVKKPNISVKSTRRVGSISAPHFPLGSVCVLLISTLKHLGSVWIHQRSVVPVLSLTPEERIARFPSPLALPTGYCH